MSNTNNKTKNFVLLYAGQVISQLGSSMTGFATIIWAYTQNEQVLASSLLAICNTIPYLLVSLFGGAIVDSSNKKKVMLVCDSIAAIGSLIILVCYYSDFLQLWLLCIINIISGFMNAFQLPASQVAVSLLIEKENYVKIGGIQSIVSSIVNILTPILAAGMLSFGGLGLILCIDLLTFIVAFLTLLLLVKIPENQTKKESFSIKDTFASTKEGISFLKQEKGILYLLAMYSVLEFVGAISFDGMYSPLLLARTNNNELIVGIVSTFMAVGTMLAGFFLMVIKQPQKKLSIMYMGSTMCLLGIMLFGMGRTVYWWCIVVSLGCFGSPIYSTYQNALLREKVNVTMQGRIFALQGMINAMLTPFGYLLGAVLADYVLEPFMKTEGKVQSALSVIVGKGAGAGIGLIFVVSGFVGIILLFLLSRNKDIRTLDTTT